MSLYPENPAGQILQVVSQDTLANAYSALSVVGGGGAGPVPAPVDVITTSTITLNTITNSIGSLISMNNANAGLFIVGAGDTSISLDGGSFSFEYLGENGSGGKLTENAKTFSFNDNFSIDGSGNLLFQDSKGVIDGAASISATSITNLSSINGAPYSAGGAPTPNPFFSTVGISSILNFQANTGAITNLSTVNGAPYVAGGGALTNSPTFSTIQVSTIQTPVTVSNITGGIAFNTVIGGMRITAGLAYPVTNAGVTTITYPTPFATIPTVLTGCTGDVGVNTTAMLISAGENSLGLTVNVATSTYVNWIAFGAA